MRKILTADQYLTSILAMLRLSGNVDVPGGTRLDLRFEEAYETLLQHEKNLDVTPNFTFFRDPLHGNSARLRNALLAAKENGLLRQDTGRSFCYSIRMDEKRAQTLVKQSSLPSDFLSEIVQKHFAQLPTSTSS